MNEIFNRLAGAMKLSKREFIVEQVVVETHRKLR
jgi:hypothetical protein